MASGRAARGNEEGSYITEATHGRLAEFVRGLVPQSIDWYLESWDIVQDSWVTALESERVFEGESEDDFVSWLCGIARNKYRNARRTHAVTHRQWLSGHGHRPLEAFEGNERPPDVQLAQDEIYQRVYAAIEGALTNLEAVLVDLVILKDCTVAEIASSCRVSRRRIDRGLSRALRKLARHLDRVAPEIRNST